MTGIKGKQTVIIILIGHLCC